MGEFLKSFCKLSGSEKKTQHKERKASRKHLDRSELPAAAETSETINGQ